MDNKWKRSSRAENPQTSKDAEAFINEKGIRKTHAQIVLDLIINAPGKTTGEIGELSGLGQMESRKRLSNLKNKNLIRMGPSKVWLGSGRNQSTWYPIIPEPIQTKMAFQ